MLTIMHVNWTPQNWLRPLWLFALYLLMGLLVAQAQPATSVHPKRLEAKDWLERAEQALPTSAHRALDFAARGLNKLEAQDAIDPKADGPLQVNLHIVMGKAYFRQGLSKHAVKSFRQAVSLSRTYRYEEGLVVASEQLASLRDEAENELDQLSGLAKFGKNIGNQVNRWMDQPPLEEVLLDLQRKALEQAAELEAQRANYGKALEHQQKLMEMYAWEQDSVKMVELRHRMAALYHQQGKHEEALALVNRNSGFASADSSHFAEGAGQPAPSARPPSRPPQPAVPQKPEIIISLEKDARDLEEYAEAIEERGDLRAALNAQKEYASLLQRLQEAELQRERDSSRAAHLLEQQAVEVELLKQKSENQSLKIQQQTTFQWSLVVGIALMLLVLALLAGLLVYRGRSHKKLSRAYNELNEAHGQLKAAQAKLVESEKLASLGQLTAGIAHEINNPINFISGNIPPLQRDLNDLYAVLNAYDKAASREDVKPHFKDVHALKEEVELAFITEEIQHLIKGIGEGASRTAEIVRGLRVFARMDEAVRKPFDVHQGLDATLTLLKNKARQVEIKRSYGELPLISAFPGKMNQVFMNLLTNALQAIEGKGIISIYTHTWDPRQAADKASFLAVAEEWIQISIKDTGKGIPEGIKARIFEPFFTTKDVEEGTGLGLAISKSIMEEHQGRMAFNSQEGKGTEVLLLLPVEPVKEAETAPTLASPLPEA